MKLRQAVKYRYKSFLDIFIIYYIFICAVTAILVIAWHNEDFSQGTYINAYTSSILLFSFTIMSFKAQFNFFQQNNVTRQDMHFSFLSFLPVSLICAILDFLFYIFINYNIKNIYPLYNLVGRQPLKAFVFVNYYSYSKQLLIMFIFLVCLYSFVMSLGYLLSIIYYRLSWIKKVLFTIFVPLFIGLFFIITAEIGVSTYLSHFISGSGENNFLYSPDKAIYYKNFFSALIIMSAIFVSSGHILLIKTQVRK